MVLTVIAMLFCAVIPVSAAGASVAVTASTTKPSVGGNVTVTVKYTAPSTIGSVDATVKYDASVLEYVSATGATASGGSGVVTLSYFETSSSPSKTRTVTLNFKAKKAGTSAVNVTTSEIADWTNYTSLGTPSGKVTVNVQNPQKSGNANLSALYISSGSLSPKFSANVTSYSIVIPNSVTVLTLSAETEDKDATIAIEGSKNMKVGKNVRKVIVTAPNGTTKTYTLNITRQEATGNATDKTQTGATTAPQAGNEAAKVTVGDAVLYIATDLKDITLPQGYEQVELTVNDVAFPSVQDKSRSITLLYLVDEAGKNGAFYVYDTAAMTFSEFASATVQAGVYAILMPDAATVIPDGFTQKFVQLGDKTVVAWAFPQAEQADYYLVYALSPQGTKGLYRYDTVENTFQRYVHIESAPTVADEVPEPQVDNSSIFAKITDFFSGLLARYGAVRLILVSVAVVLLLTALIIAIVLIAKRPRNCKH